MEKENGQKVPRLPHQGFVGQRVIVSLPSPAPVLRCWVTAIRQVYNL